MSVAVHMLVRVLTCLLACCCLSAAGPALAQPGREVLVVANLLLPARAWPARQAEIAGLLQQAAVDVVLVQQVRADDRHPPSVCSLAAPLHMQCDFVTVDPPSLPQRQGTVMLSRLPVLEDGASLLHGKDDSPPVAAGYWRLQLGVQTINLYSASLSMGSGLDQRRLQQASDLRHWMASHDPATASVVVARFGSAHAELLQLMPGLATTRPPRGPGQSHGLDVLYPPRRLQLQASKLLELPPSAPAPADGAARSAPAQLLGIVVSLQLPASAAAP